MRRSSIMTEKIVLNDEIGRKSKTSSQIQKTYSIKYTSPFSVYDISQFAGKGPNSSEGW